VKPFQQPGLSHVVADDPARHVIAQYIHRARIVRCTCGLELSSASPDRLPSPWERHVRANRGEGDTRR
jgi:hypothetical protein